MYTDTVSSFKVFNLDIIPSLNIECLYDFDFIDRFVCENSSNSNEGYNSC